MLAIATFPTVYQHARAVDKNVLVTISALAAISFVTPTQELPQLPRVTPRLELPQLPCVTPTRELPHLPCVTPRQELPQLACVTPMKDLPHFPSVTAAINDLSLLHVALPLAVPGHSFHLSLPCQCCHVAQQSCTTDWIDKFQYQSSFVHASRKNTDMCICCYALGGSSSLLEDIDGVAGIIMPTVR